MPTMTASEQLAAYADGVVNVETEHRVVEPVVRKNAAPEAISAIRKVLLMANVIRDGGPIDGAVVWSEINRLVISALEETP